MGEIALSPIGLSMVNKLTPIRFASLMMGIWYLSTATISLQAILSGLYPEAWKGENTAWLMHRNNVRLLHGICRNVCHRITYPLPALKEIAEDDAWSGINSLYFIRILNINYLRAKVLFFRTYML